VHRSYSTMDREARHRAEAHWLSTLCSQLRGCQTASDVADVVDVLDQAPLFGSQIGDVLDRLQTATQYKDLLALVLAGECSYLRCVLRATYSCRCRRLSGSSWSAHLSVWLSKRFPVSAEEYLSSPHGEIMERLSIFLQFLDCPVDRRTQTFLNAARIRTELSPPVLRALGGLPTDQQGNGNSSTLSTMKTFQKAKGRDRKVPSCSKGSDKSDLEQHLETLGLPFQTSDEGKQRTIVSLLAMLKDDLQVCCLAILSSVCGNL